MFTAFFAHVPPHIPLMLNANPAVLPGRNRVGKGVGRCGGVGGKVQGTQQITGTQCTVLEFGDTKSNVSEWPKKEIPIGNPIMF